MFSKFFSFTFIVIDCIQLISVNQFLHKNMVDYAYYLCNCHYLFKIFYIFYYKSRFAATVRFWYILFIGPCCVTSVKNLCRIKIFLHKENSIVWELQTLNVHLAWILNDSILPPCYSIKVMKRMTKIPQADCFKNSLRGAHFY